MNLIPVLDMRMKTTEKLIPLLLFLSSITNLNAWEEHFRITEAALKSFPLLHEQVQYETLETALAQGLQTVKARTVREFILELKLNKNWRFRPRLNEAVGRPADVRSILAIYSDEPDWGGDMDLFEADQYPELWTEDSPYVTMRSGPGSQAFRHMYFSGVYDWFEPLASFQLPLHAVGAAPARAQLYYDLAQDFFRARRPYWGYRFLAWALHIVQDLYQPFHVRQTPSSAFFRFTWKWGFLPQPDVEATAQQIYHYHSSYEIWMRRQVQMGDVRFLDAIGGGRMAAPITEEFETFILNDPVSFSAARAAELGKACVAVLPLSDSGLAIDSAAWYQGIHEGPELTELRTITQTLFAEMGRVVRRVVHDSVSRI